MFALNTEVIYTNDECTQILSGVVTRIVDKQTVKLDNKKDSFHFAAFLWPDNEESRGLLTDIITQHARHEKERGDMLTRQIELGNKFHLAGLK